MFNKNQIVSIETQDARVNRSFKFLKAKEGFLGFGKREEGIYEFNPYRKEVLMDRVPSNMFKRENTIFYKPCVTITYSNGAKEEVFFNNYIEIKKFINREFNGNEWKREVE